MAVNNNDEYYTPDHIVSDVMSQLTSLNLGITGYVEPSAGGGAFLPYLPDDTLAIDINPKSDLVIYGDFLDTTFPYQEGLCVVGNPPFGNRNSLAVKFFKKSVNLGDYVAFILPISQLDNQQQMFQFNLIHSEDLGVHEYSGVKVHCCFNVYRRPKGGSVNTKKPTYEVPGVSYFEFRRGGCNNVPVSTDIGFCRFGSSVGKQPTTIGKYAQEGYLLIDSKLIQNKEGLIQHLKEFDWVNHRPSVSTPTLYKWEIMKVVDEYVQRTLCNQS